MNPEQPRPDKQDLDQSRLRPRGDEPDRRPDDPLSGGPSDSQERPGATPPDAAPDARSRHAFSPAGITPDTRSWGASPSEEAAANRLWGPSGPQSSRPGLPQGMQPATPRPADPRSVDLGSPTAGPGLLGRGGTATGTPAAGSNPLARGLAGGNPAASGNPLARGLAVGNPAAGGAAPRPLPGGNPLLSRPVPAASPPAAGNPLAGGAVARPLPGVNPLAGGGAAPRQPSRAGVSYRGLPWPVRMIGWLTIAIAVGAVIGATAPTALMRIGAVAAIQPSLLAWYSVRAMGFLAYFVLAASVLYGLLLSTKILDAIAHRPVSFALHKDLAIVAMILATLHGALLIFDTSFDFTPRSLIVPFASPYSPITVGIGQLTFYASLVVTASFYIRRHIGQRAWRILHYVTFLSFIGATYHGIASGSDSGSSWAFWVYLAPATAAIFLLTYRIVISFAARLGRSRDRAAGIPAQLGPVRGPLDRPGAFPGGF